MAEPSSDVSSVLERCRVLTRSGQPEVALAVLDIAITQIGPDPDLLSQRASCLHRLGRTSEALAALRTVVEAQPECFAAQIGLGRVLAALGHMQEAAAHFLAATRLRPDDASAFHNLAEAQWQLEDASGAAQSFARAVALKPDLVASHVGLGRAHAALGRAAEAERAYETAIRLQPADAALYTGLGTFRAGRGEWARALPCFEKARDLAPERAEIHFNLGAALEQLLRRDEALACFERALALRPQFPEAAAHLAGLLERQNRIDEARQAVERALVLDPNNTEALLVRGRLERREGDHEAARRTLERLLESPLLPERRVAVLNQLGKALEDMQAYAQAFETYDKANAVAASAPKAISAKKVPYLSRIRRCRAYFTAERVSRWSRHPAADGPPTPIFFVGFPRSGTTLVERMLESHDNLVGTGELPLIDEMINGLSRILGRDAAYPEGLDALSQTDIATLVGWYCHQVERRLDGYRPGQRVVDKLPLNLIHLGLVRRIFPEAKVLVAIRDPRDVCLSCFKQSFVPNPAMVHFLDLSSTARLYRAVMELWLHYRDVLGLDCLAYRYEDLVAEPEATLRRVFDHLEEPWDEGVLGYHEKGQAGGIYTPSYQDVTRPLYDRAIGQWRNFRTQLESILPVLAPFVREFGYDS